MISKRFTEYSEQDQGYSGITPLEPRPNGLGQACAFMYFGWYRRPGKAHSSSFDDGDCRQLDA